MEAEIPFVKCGKGLTLSWWDGMGLIVSRKGDFAEEWMRCNALSPILPSFEFLLIGTTGCLRSLIVFRYDVIVHDWPVCIKQAHFKFIDLD